MIDGTVKHVDWNQYESPNFEINLEHKYDSHHCCASCALSMISGISPKRIDAWKTGDKSSWHTISIKKWLVQHGYTVITVTKNSVTNVGKGNSWLNCPLNNNHVILMNCMVNHKENSAVVCHAGQLWHNFEHDFEFNPLFFLNKPAQDVFVIFNKKWKNKRKHNANWKTS